MLCSVCLRPVSPAEAARCESDCCSALPVPADPGDNHEFAPDALDEYGDGGN